MSQLQSHSLLPYDIGDRPVPGYTLRRYLGGGAIGHVWLAETDNGFQQAIKVVDLRESGGRKEFRGLRTVKQRRLLSGYLLTLIDYWLKDAAGNIVPDVVDGAGADHFFGRSSVLPPPSPELSGTTSQALDKTPGGAADKKSPPKGTLIHSAEDSGTEPTLAPPSSPPVKTPPRPERQRPVQLIVAMELGHKTLFDRLKECRADAIGSGIP
jgi:hypothetical protein